MSNNKQAATFWTRSSSHIVRHSPVFIFTKIKHVYIYIAWSKKAGHKQAKKNHLSVLCLWLRWCHSHHELSPETADTEYQEFV